MPLHAPPPHAQHQETLQKFEQTSTSIDGIHARFQLALILIVVFMLAGAVLISTAWIRIWEICLHAPNLCQ